MRLGNPVFGVYPSRGFGDLAMQALNQVLITAAGILLAVVLLLAALHYVY